MHWQERAVKNIQAVLGRTQGDRLFQLIKAAAALKGSESTFERIARAARSEDTAGVLDYFAEIRWGLTFSELKFEAEFEPCGKEGPDLLVSRDGHSAYVEVKRFRPSLEDDGPTAGIEGELMPYGDLQRSVKKIGDELAKKFRQVEAGSGIVAFWSDHTAIEDVDFELAIRSMWSDNETPATPAADAIAYTQTTCSTGAMPTPQSSAANTMDKPCSPTWQAFTPTQPHKPGNKT
ncbi:MAG: hypothetical protein WCA19_22265 [Candidatus Acidiferrales bacterium]